MPSILARLARPVRAIGRLGTTAVALSLFLGMALPPVSALIKPILPITVFLLLTVAMIRIDPAELRPIARAPWRFAALVGWTMIVVPLVVTGVIAAIGLPDRNPDLTLAIALMAAAPPIMSVPAFCMLLGLNGGLAFVLLVAAMVVAPLTAPLASWMFLGEALPISPAGLALRLALYLATALIAAILIRRRVGIRKIRRNGDVIDGLNVIFLFLFAVALMDGVAAATVRDPGMVAGLIGLSFLIAGGIVLATTLAFVGRGVHDALAVGLTAGNRNMGLMASVLVANLPDLTWIYFALAQFPIYLLPVMMRPVVSWLKPAGPA